MQSKNTPIEINQQQQQENSVIIKTDPSPKLKNIEKEIEYLKKLNITQTNIKGFLSYKTSLLNNSLSEKKETLQYQSQENQNIKNNNLKLQQSLSQIKNEGNILENKYVQFTDIKEKLNEELIALRKERTSKEDLFIKRKENDEKMLSKLQKELSLLINMIQFRIVNFDNYEKDKQIKGYMINIERTDINFYSMNIEGNDIKKGECYINYWKQLKEFLEKK